MTSTANLQSRASASVMDKPSFANLPWFAGFPVAMASLFVLQPSLHSSAAMIVTASVLMMVFAAAACDPQQTAMRLRNISVLSPVFAALMIWVSVDAGRAIGGESLILGSLAAFATLASLYLAEAIVSAVGLYAVTRSRAAPGAAVVALIHAKYAGLFGRIV